MEYMIMASLGAIEVLENSFQSPREAGDGTSTRQRGNDSQCQSNTVPATGFATG
jgi:hypothetical protein